MTGYHKASFQSHSFSHFTVIHFTPFQRIPQKKNGGNNETKHIFLKKCPKKLRECLVLCTQLLPAPFSNIFLLIHSSWWFLISPQCLGIAVFLEANLLGFAHASLGLDSLKKVFVRLNHMLFAGFPWQVTNS